MDCNTASWHFCPLLFLPHHGKLPPCKTTSTRLGGPLVTSVPSTYINHLCAFRALVLQCLLSWAHACAVGWPRPLLRLGNGAQCMKVHLWAVAAMVSWAAVTVSHRLVASEKGNFLLLMFWKLQVHHQDISWAMFPLNSPRRPLFLSLPASVSRQLTTSVTWRLAAAPWLCFHLHIAFWPVCGHASSSENGTNQTGLGPHPKSASHHLHELHF